jgi:hypothetical protein
VWSVPDVFALKMGSLRGTVELLEPLLEVRFKKTRIPKLEVPWFIALSRDRREHMIVFPNDKNGRSIDAAADGFETLFYLVRSPREEKLVRLISTETRFRYVRPTDRVMAFAEEVLAELEGDSRPA